MADRVNAPTALAPDPNTRKCVSCEETYAPFSMAADKNIVVDTGDKDPEGRAIMKVLDEEVVLPPVDYRCMSCRAKAAKA